MTNFSDNVECIGSGSYGFCYEVAMRFNTKSSHEDFVFKKLNGKYISTLEEITIFSHIPIDEQHGFCRPQSMAIGNDGKCAGYLMKYAEFGILANFARKHQGNDYRYFYNQLFNVAKAINTLHQKGISHNDVKLYNIFVCKKDDTEGENNYYFQLGDFGRSYITSRCNSDDDSDESIQKKHDKTTISEYIASRCSDLQWFIQLSKDLVSFYLDNENKSQQEPLGLTTALKGFCTFDGIKKYFKDIDISFTNTDSIKSST